MKRFVWVAGLTLVCAIAGKTFARPDLSSPKSATLAFLKAMEAADLDAAKAVVAADAENQEMAALATDAAAARNKLRDVAKAKFGEEALTKIAPKSDPEQQLADSNIVEDGDSATVNNKTNPQNSMKLKKVDGQWRVDLSAAAKQSAFIKSLTGAMNEVATEINDGKFKTADDAITELRTKLLTAMATMKKPTSAPATKPGN